MSISRLSLAAFAAVLLVACGKKADKTDETAAAPPAALPPPAPALPSLSAVTLGKGVGADKRVTAPADTFSVRDTIFVSSYSTGVYALDPKDGSTRWRFEVEGAGSVNYDVKGKITDHQYEFERDGQKVAEVSKRWFRIRDTYGVEIGPNEDVALVLAATVAIDQMTHEVG